MIFGEFFRKGGEAMRLRQDYRYTFYASYAGYFVQAIINNFLPLLFLTLQKDFDLSYDKISLLIVINFGVQLIVDMASASFIDRIGYRASALLAHAFAFTGLFSLGIFPFILPPYFGIILSIVIYATGSGLIEVIISPLVEACPSRSKSGSMSLLHSFYCWGQMSVVLLSTVFFVLCGVEKWRYLALLWSLVPLINGIFFTLVPIPDTLSDSRSMTVRELFGTKLFYVFALIMLCSGASEIAMSQWASAFAESGLKVSKTAGDLLGPCLFAALMGTARVFYSKISEKISLRKMMTACSLLCIASYLTAGLSPQPLLSLFGCAVCGLSVGIMWPGTFSLAAEKLPSGGTAMFAFLALFGDMGCSTGPAAVGKAISLSGGDMSRGMLTGTLFPALLIFGLYLMHRRAPTKS